LSNAPEIGKKAPNFNRPATGNKFLSLKDFKGKKLVIYFYPKDATPGCTTEGQNFRDLYPKFQAANCDILGVSKDSLRSHERFKEKQSFPFDLLADEDESMCQAYNVIKLKKLYGREYMGIERSTFLIDEQGKLRHEWRKVKVKDHAEEVLAAVQSL
jgi:peroxiredoxin Q/BCP